MKTVITATLSLLSIFYGKAQVLYVQNGADITVQNTADISILGDVSLENGSMLTNNGVITVRHGASATANWTDNTATGYNYGTGSFIFSGTGNQSILSNNIFERIEVNNTGLNLASDISTNKWYLINGPVNTGAFRAIALSPTATGIEADATNTGFANSWINGNLRRYITPATVNNYLFPVGNTTQVNIAEMDNLTASALNNITYIDAFIAPKAGTDAGLSVTESGSAYTAVNDGGIWHLLPDAAPSAGTYDLKLYFNGFTGLTDNQFAILRRPEGSSDAADWSVPAGSSVNSNGGEGRMVADGYARRNSLSSFSEFGIGQLSNPLPVTLVNFDVARLNTARVQVTWETQTEQLNKGFDVERRLDNETIFTQKGFVASLAPDGNSSNPLRYHYTDANGYSGISYYRLKQIDLDLTATYTMIKAVKGSGQTQVSVLIWPNPTAGQFSIRMENADGPKEARILDIYGKLVQKIRVTNQQQVNVSQLGAGVYILYIPNAFGEGNHFTERILVIR